MRKGILGPTGAPISKSFAKKTPAMDKFSSIEESLGKEDMSKLDLVPMGPYMIAETLNPAFISEGGIHMPFGVGDFPLYRILRMGQKKVYPNEFARLGKGDIVFDKSESLFEVFHRFNGDNRLLVLLNVMNVEAIVSKFRWSEQEPEEDSIPISPDRNMEEPMIDFEPKYVEAVQSKMMMPEDIENIDMKPVGSYIIVENAPVKDISGSVLTTGNAMPLFRVLKVPEDKNSIPEHLRFIEPGDMTLITMLDRRGELPHCVPPGKDGERKRIYLANVGSVIGWYPSLSWRFQKADLEESTTCQS
jgi:hypothetical protein